MNPKVQDVLVAIILQTVKEVKEAPEGPMYAAFMGYGCSLEQFQILISKALATGEIKRKGHLLYAS